MIRREVRLFRHWATSPRLRPLAFPLTAIMVGTLMSLCLPEPSWARYITAFLWASAFLVFGHWLVTASESGYISDRSFEVALHFWILCGVFTYASLEAARADVRVPPTIWITACVLASLLVRLLVKREGEHERHGEGK